MKAKKGSVANPKLATKDVGRRPLRNFGRIRIDQVVADPSQPRSEFSAEAIKQLAKSIQEKGQLAPIHVRWSADIEKWIIVCGERRWRAAKAAKLETIDCRFDESELSAAEILEQQMIENLLREDLSPIEQARGFSALMELHGWNGKQVAESLHVPASTEDELFVWGMLALTLADENSDGELHVTRHYLLKQLGLIDSKTRRGGRQYIRITDAIDRVAAVQYFNDGFYDPIRSEHRKVNFGFFSYSMPADLSSSRAWRIVWDPIFFEFAKAARGALRFDLSVYRQLDIASRRLYLFASKVLCRRDITHPMRVDELVTNVLGYDPTLAPFEQNARMRKCLRNLAAFGILHPKDTQLYKRSKNRYAVVMAKGAFLRKPVNNLQIESPLFEPLCEIGFKPMDAKRLLMKYSAHLVREWIDITLAAKERFGPSFFKRSPAAYLRYYLDRAATGKDGPPDWWHDVRKAEEHARAERARKRRSTQVPNQLPQKAMDSLDNVRDDIFHQFLAAGQSKKQAAENARRFKTASQAKP